MSAHSTAPQPRRMPVEGRSGAVGGGVGARGVANGGCGQAGRFSVLLCDPPWAYRVGGNQGDVDEQYTVMAYADIAAIPVAKWAAPDCVLALWGTWPKVDEAVALLADWDFAFVTGFPWIKTVGATIRRGVGYWTQSASEYLLIGRRGEPRRRECGTPIGLLAGEDRQFWAPNCGHSVKPPGIHEWLEGLLPGPYCELFARRPRPGWVTWGLDTGFRLSAAGVEQVAIPTPVQADLFSSAPQDADTGPPGPAQL